MPVAGQGPTVAIVVPTNQEYYETRYSLIDLSGTATDDVSVSRVKWESATGDSGTAIGTSTWSIVGVPLVEGENQIVVMALDADGNKGIQTLKVKYTPVKYTPPRQISALPPALGHLGEGYIIDPGDVLEISVWRDEALTKVVTVLPDGKFAFPLLGEIMAQGKTVAQLQKELTAKIKPFVPDPVVTIVVQQANSMFIYVIGKVNSPGRFSLNGMVDVLQALAMAGGFNPFAERDSVKIFRRSADETEIFEFKYDEVSEGTNLEQNIALRKGDVIVVP